MGKFLEFISTNFSSAHLYLLRDYNLDLFKINCIQKCFDLCSIMCPYGLSTAILRLTIAAKLSETLIDQTWYRCRDISLNLKSGVIPSEISDNFPIFVRINDFDSSVIGDDAYVY